MQKKPTFKNHKAYQKKKCYLDTYSFVFSNIVASKASLVWILARKFKWDIIS